jgi:predicted NodU family carbamoyl transferase
MNTSFNARREPIVTTPDKVFVTIANSGICTLVSGDYLVVKH